MNESRNIMYNDVLDCLSEIFDRNSRFCEYDVLYFLKKSTNDGRTLIDTNHPVGSFGYTPIEITVGTKSLMEHMLPDGSVRDEDAVWVLIQGFHESTHLWQYTVGYMQENSSWLMQHMARGRAISVCFPEHGHSAYLSNISELFADRYAVSQVKHFVNEKVRVDSRFANIDVDGIVCMHELRRRSNISSDLKMCHTTDDVLNVYDRLLRKLPYEKKFDVDYMISHMNPGKHFCKFLKDRVWFDKVMNAKDGLAESDLLCQYIGLHHPECFRGILCIRDEYCDQNIRGKTNTLMENVMRVLPQKWVDLYEESVGCDSGSDFDF